MCKCLVCVYLCFFIVPQAHAQTINPVRYKDFVFSDVTITKDLYYNENIPEDTKKKYYLYDLYQPAADSTTKYRPLIIWMHGGGFKFGSKKAHGIQLWSKAFAQRGYVCAAINYRLSKKNPLTHFSTLVKSCSEAVSDVEQAVVYFKKNSERLRIDTNKIILAGNSAGGITALQAVYSSPLELARLADKKDTGNYSTAYNPEKIAAVVNFWGALFDIHWLKNGHVPIVSVHGSNDHIVPISHQNSALYGSLSVHLAADSLHIVNRIKIYAGFSHELQRHFNPFFVGSAAKKRWQEAGQFAADFLYDTLYK